MKNIFIMLALAIVTSTNGNAHAQKIEAISSASISQLSKSNAAQQIMRNQVPSKAYRHFMKTYTEKDERWQIDANGLVAIFYRDGMSQMSFYDRKGNWKSSVFNYAQAKLPKAIFNLVKSAYCDYTITHCSEVKMNSESIYHITILKDTDYKVLKVWNDEIQLQNQYVYNKGEQNSNTPLTKQ